MTFGDIRTGTVVSYQYLWRREALAGRTEGAKPRPCAVAIRVHGKQHDLIYLMPLTTKEPDSKTIAIEVPQIEKRRAGLDAGLRHWLILQELNVDILPGSYVLEPDALMGSFSKAWFGEVLSAWKKNFGRSALTKRR